MSGQQDQQVTIRLLPDGANHPAVLDKLNGQLLWLGLSSPAGPETPGPGDLVEVTCPTTLYLGTVRTHQGATMMIAVEHALDRETLAVIQEVWKGPAGR
ncbi:MAG TPA: hypothetical protein VHZ74_22625 [Bryobacteraceae bacterium]|jgi:hypothetical protein|nr:hypothetical protein [Bryobacteraceae bacterium]